MSTAEEKEIQQSAASFERESVGSSEARTKGQQSKDEDTACSQGSKP